MKKFMMCALFVAAISLAGTSNAQEPQKKTTCAEQCCKKNVNNNPKQCPQDRKACCVDNKTCNKPCKTNCDKTCKATCDKTCKEICDKPCKSACDKPCKETCTKPCKK